jgi:serine/threonine kinase 38
MRTASRPDARFGLSVAAVSEHDLEKASLTKALIDEKMSTRRRELEEKRRRREQFQEMLSDPTLTEEDRKHLTEEFDRQERQYSIEMRKRYSKDDFEPLAVIGKGAFGEVCE